MFTKIFLLTVLLIGGFSAQADMQQKCFDRFAAKWSFELVNKANDSLKLEIKKLVQGMYVASGDSADQVIDMSELFTYRGVTKCSSPTSYSCERIGSNYYPWADTHYRGQYFVVLVYNKNGTVKDSFHAQAVGLPLVKTAAEEVISPIGQRKGIQCSMAFGGEFRFLLTNAKTGIITGWESIRFGHENKELIP